MLVRSFAAAAALVASLALLPAPALAQGTARQRAVHARVSASAHATFQACAASKSCMIHNFDRLSRRCQAVFYDPYDTGTRYRGHYNHYYD